MQKLLMCVAALFGASAALAQSLPSPVFKNVTVNGTITAPELPNLSANVEGTGMPGLDGGHWFIWNSPDSFESNETFRVDRHINSGTGLTGNTYKALSVFGTNNPSDAGYEWTTLSNQYNTANASTGSQNVSVAAYMFKKPPTNTYQTTGASGTGWTATVTFSGGATIPVGYTVQVAGVAPSGYNGVYKVTASSAGSVSFASTATGGQTVAGTVLNTSVGASWGLNASCEDDTVDFDPIAGCLGAEIDVTATTATTDANRQRVGLQIALGGPSGSHVGRGLLMGANGGVITDRAFEINGPYGIGLDFTGSTFSTAPVFLAGGQKVVFDGTSGGTYNWALSDISGTMALRYGSTNGFTLDSSGNFNATGGLSTAGTVSANGLILSTAGFSSSGSGTAGAWNSTVYSKTPALVITGSPPTASGTCSINTKVGGNTAGSFKLNGACASGTVILTFATTAPNDWACFATDATTVATTISQNNTTASTTTATLKFNATGASGDLIRFSCMAF